MAGRRIADLLIKIGADSYEFQQKSKEVEKGVEQLSQRLTSIGKTMSLAVIAPLTAIGVVALRNADIQQRAEAKVQQAIRSTAGAAQLSFEQLASYASELQARVCSETRRSSITSPPSFSPSPTLLAITSNGRRL